MKEKKKTTLQAGFFCPSSYHRDKVPINIRPPEFWIMIGQAVWIGFILMRSFRYVLVSTVTEHSQDVYAGRLIGKKSPQKHLYSLIW